MRYEKFHESNQLIAVSRAVHANFGASSLGPQEAVTKPPPSRLQDQADVRAVEGAARNTPPEQQQLAEPSLRNQAIPAADQSGPTAIPESQACLEDFDLGQFEANFISSCMHAFLGDINQLRENAGGSGPGMIALCLDSTLQSFLPSKKQRKRNQRSW